MYGAYQVGFLLRTVFPKLKSEGRQADDTTQPSTAVKIVELHLHSHFRLLSVIRTNNFTFTFLTRAIPLNASSF
jgi:hypothetical protein